MSLWVCLQSNLEEMRRFSASVWPRPSGLPSGLGLQRGHESMRRRIFVRQWRCMPTRLHLRRTRSAMPFSRLRNERSLSSLFHLRSRHGSMHAFSVPRWWYLSLWVLVPGWPVRTTILSWRQLLPFWLLVCQRSLCCYWRPHGGSFCTLSFRRTWQCHHASISYCSVRRRRFLPQ